MVIMRKKRYGLTVFAGCLLLAACGENGGGTIAAEGSSGTVPESVLEGVPGAENAAEENGGVQNTTEDSSGAENAAEESGGTQNTTEDSSGAGKNMDEVSNPYTKPDVLESNEDIETLFSERLAR